MEVVVMDDMASADPAPLGPSGALLGLIPREPYSADQFPSNWQMWRNLPTCAVVQLRLPGWGDLPLSRGV